LLLEAGGEDLTPEEREAAARPIHAGQYWKLWDAFHVAQRLWANEVALIDNRSRDKTNKKSLGNRTAALRNWFNGLSTSRLDEAKKAAAKWNLEGAPDKDKMLMYVLFAAFKGLLINFLPSYRKKNLRNRTVEFIEAMRRTMGVHCVVLEGYKAPDGVKTL